MSLSQNDNIVAIATASGYSGIGIARISGTNLYNILPSLTQKTKITPRQVTYTDFFDASGEIIDSGVVIYFAAPNSFTGEDVIEIQGHGSPIILNLLIRRAIELGCRMANPGEFSERAYLNGKIDLVQAESIIDLIYAESESSAKGAIKSLKGTFSNHINTINQKLIDLRMFVEASIDFPEEDIEFIATAKIKNKLELLQEEIKQLLNSTKQGVLLNNGANIVIIGRPNVGKSSILNCLANEEIAIVTDIAGTTRDIIKEKIIINGITFNIIDTAGIRETTDQVEQIGIERALKSIDSADICLIILDATNGITEEDTEILAKIPNNIPQIYVHNKIDLISKSNPSIENNHVYMSAKNSIGIDDLRNTILKNIGFDSNSTDVFVARERHLNSMLKCVEHIDNAFLNWQNLELLAEELRYAHTDLGEITGEFSSDQLLGEIFSRFCIGK